MISKSNTLEKEDSIYFLFLKARVFQKMEEARSSTASTLKEQRVLRFTDINRRN